MGYGLPESHADCWPIEKARKGIVTHDEALRILFDEGYFESPVYMGVGEYVEVSRPKHLKRRHE